MPSAVEDIEQNPVRMYRRSNGWTLDQMARSLGVNRQSIQAWETGGGYPAYPNVMKLAALDPDLPEALRKWRTGEG